MMNEYLREMDENYCTGFVLGKASSILQLTPRSGVRGQVSGVSGHERATTHFLIQNLGRVGESRTFCPLHTVHCTLELS